MALCQKSNRHPSEKKLEHSRSWLYSSNRIPLELNDIVSIECRTIETAVVSSKNKTEGQDFSDMQKELSDSGSIECRTNEEDVESSKSKTEGQVPAGVQQELGDGGSKTVQLWVQKDSNEESEYHLCYRGRNIENMGKSKESDEVLRSSYICSIEEASEEDETEIKKDKASQPSMQMPVEDVLYELSGDAVGTETLTRNRHLQNSFKMAQKYRHFFSWRRPSDITDLQSHSAQEEAIVEKFSESLFEMDSGPRRHSDNFIERQKRFMNARLHHLRELWNERIHVAGSQQDVSVDQDLEEKQETCEAELCQEDEEERSTHLVFRPLTRAEDNEKIVDTLRNVVRKCTNMNPSLRPTASEVYNLLRKGL